MNTFVHLFDSSKKTSHCEVLLRPQADRRAKSGVHTGARRPGCDGSESSHCEVLLRPQAVRGAKTRPSPWCSPSRCEESKSSHCEVLLRPQVDRRAKPKHSTRRSASRCGGSKSSHCEVFPDHRRAVRRGKHSLQPGPRRPGCDGSESSHCEVVPFGAGAHRWHDTVSAGWRCFMCSDITPEK